MVEFYASVIDNYHGLVCLIVFNVNIVQVSVSC